MTRNQSAHNRGDRDERLASDIRHQFGTEAMTRFARTLPAFRVDTSIPERFRELLTRLDSNEPNASATGR